MLPRILLLGLLAAMEFTAIAIAAEPEAVTIRVAPGERQAFQGFGASIANFDDAYGKLAQVHRDELAGAVWRDLRFSTLRLWFITTDFAPTRGTRDLGVFKRRYIDQGIVADAKKHGMTTLLLAPDGIPDYMADKLADGTIALKDSEVENYALLLADAIEELRRLGVRIDVTGISNEPSDEQKFAPAQIAGVVRHLRRSLDGRGLREVRIIATENASANDVFAREVDALKADPAAWAALAGISSHSYNMAANDEIAGKIAGPDGRNTKEYWMTEASDNGPEVADDAFRATSIAARFLNDMNHRVTHWVHFLAYERVIERDDATKLITYTLPPDVRITRLLKFYVYQQLGHAFDRGCIFRDSTSSLDGDMTWTYGRKPRLIAATAKNPDGSWAIGVANYTADSFLGVQGWGDDKWNREQGGHTPAQRFMVTIEIPELESAGPLIFQARRTGAGRHNVADQPVTMTAGRVTVEVAPLELLTLRSLPPPAE